jgi:hypothetical protein
VQIREYPVVPEATQVVVDQVDQAEFIKEKFREDPVVPQATQVVLVPVEVIQLQVRKDQVVPEVTQVLVGQVELLQLIQIHVMEDQAVPEHTLVLVVQVNDQVDLAGVFQVQEFLADQLEAFQVQGVLEARLVAYQVQVQQAVEYHLTQDSHLVEAADRLSRTENTYRLTVGNNSMTATNWNCLHVFMCT